MAKPAMVSPRPQASLAFKGPWAGLPIAWTADEAFDEVRYRQAIRACCEAGVPGVYTGGTTGEFYALSMEEFRCVTRTTIGECHQRAVPAMIGITATGTREVLRRANFAHESGADAVQLSLPFWIELTEDEVVRFFCDLADTVGPMPFSIYDTPRANQVIGLELHERIKEVAPSYAMVKAVGGTVGSTPEGCVRLSRIVNVFVSETQWAALGKHGAAGACSAMVYWNPAVSLALWQELQERNWAALEQRLVPVQRLHAFLFERFGPRGFSDGAYDRLMAEAAGFISIGLTCRSPYSSPTCEDVTLVREWLQSNMPAMVFGS